MFILQVQLCRNEIHKNATFSRCSLVLIGGAAAFKATSKLTSFKAAHRQTFFKATNRLTSFKGADKLTFSKRSES